MVQLQESMKFYSHRSQDISLPYEPQYEVVAGGLFIL